MTQLLQWLRPLRHRLFTLLFHCFRNLSWLVTSLLTCLALGKSGTFPCRVKAKPSIVGQMGRLSFLSAHAGFLFALGRFCYASYFQHAVLGCGTAAYAFSMTLLLLPAAGLVSLALLIFPCKDCALMHWSERLASVLFLAVPLGAGLIAVVTALWLPSCSMLLSIHVLLYGVPAAGITVLWGLLLLQGLHAASASGNLQPLLSVCFACSIGSALADCLAAAAQVLFAGARADEGTALVLLLVLLGMSSITYVVLLAIGAVQLAPASYRRYFGVLSPFNAPLAPPSPSEATVIPHRGWLMGSVLLAVCAAAGQGSALLQLHLRAALIGPLSLELFSLVIAAAVLRVSMVAVPSILLLLVGWLAKAMSARLLLLVASAVLSILSALVAVYTPAGAVGSSGASFPSPLLGGMLQAGLLPLLLGRQLFLSDVARAPPPAASLLLAGLALSPSAGLQPLPWAAILLLIALSLLALLWMLDSHASPSRATAELELEGSLVPLAPETAHSD